jgi:hypothetical protein
MFWKCPPFFAEERLCTIILPLMTTLKKIEHFFTQGAMPETMSITGIRTWMRPSQNRPNSDDAHGQECLHAIKINNFFFLNFFSPGILGEY